MRGWGSGWGTCLEARVFGVRERGANKLQYFYFPFSSALEVSQHCHLNGYDEYHS